MYKISIIIPVYNVCEYLEACMASLREQTIGFENLQVIMVDDHSTDKSWDLLREFAKQENVVCMRLDENSGAAGRPRNVGLAAVQAEYIMFLDADDTYYADACQVLWDAIQEKGVDCVSGYYSILEENGILATQNALSKCKIPEKVYTVPDDFAQIAEFQSHFGSKIYKKEIIDNCHIEFPERMIGEDTVFVWKYFCSIKTAYYLEAPVLKYKQRNKTNKSVSHLLTEKYFADLLETLRLIYEECKRKKYTSYAAYALKNTKAYLIIQLINSSFPAEDVERVLERLWQAGGGNQWTDSTDAYVTIIMDDLCMGNRKGAAKKIVLLRELKQYYDEVLRAKAYFEKQFLAVREENERLQKWCAEIQKGKEWLEEQNRRLEEAYGKLQKWCDQVQQGKDWLENEWKKKCEECEELRDKKRKSEKFGKFYGGNDGI